MKMVGLVTIAGLVVVGLALAVAHYGSGEEVAVEDAGAATVYQGATVAEQPALTAADLPMESGTRLVFDTNSPGDTAAVDFTLEGPWDFSEGATGDRLTISFQDAESAAMANYFPDAGIVATYSWPAMSAASTQYSSTGTASGRSATGAASSLNSTGAASSRSATGSGASALPPDYFDTCHEFDEEGNCADVAPEQSGPAPVATPRASASQYTATQSAVVQPAADELNFESIGDTSWLSYGSFGPRGFVAYSHPVQALIFPAAVGSRWNDEFDRSDNGSVTHISEANRIVGHNSLTVPAGTFDAYLLQTSVTATTGDTATVTIDYIWLVPGIGRAAEIISQAGEQNEVFTKAYAFYRLRDYSL